MLLHNINKFMLTKIFKKLKIVITLSSKIIGTLFSVSFEFSSFSNSKLEYFFKYLSTIVSDACNRNSLKFKINFNY